MAGFNILKHCLHVFRDETCNAFVLLFKILGSTHMRRPICTPLNRSFKTTVNATDNFTITSANYPYLYPENLNCTWNIALESNNTKLVILFQTFNFISEKDIVLITSNDNGLFEWVYQLQILWNRQIYALYLNPSDTVEIQISSAYLKSVNQTDSSTIRDSEMTVDETLQLNVLRGKTGVEIKVLTLDTAAKGKSCFNVK